MVILFYEDCSVWDAKDKTEALTPIAHRKNYFRKLDGFQAGLKQISSPNEAQTSFVSYEYVPIVAQPFYKAERHCCAKRL